MAMEAAMALTNRLLSQAQALAAVTAHMRATQDGEQLDPDLRPSIERIIDILEAREALAGLTSEERPVVIAFARSYLHQALELIDEPFRANSWSHSDPTILQAQGAASGVVARLIHESGLCEPDARILDIGTGVGGLAIAFCRTFPGATVVGIDPWEPSLALARANLAAAGLDDRVTLRPEPIQAFEDPEGFDLAWLPSFFIPPKFIEPSLRRIRDLLRPGGRVVVGVIEGPDDPLAGAIDAMITIRSGGAALEPDAVVGMLRDAGFPGAREVNRSWQAPLRLVTAEHPATGSRS